MKNLFKSKKGFTLVEIVIVIAIIGLLMIILIPSAINAFKNNRLQGAKIKAQRVASSLEAGIGSGKVPLTVGNAKNLGLADSDGNIIKEDAALITSATDAASAISISNVVGIENIYNLPSNNEDLTDPLGDGDTTTDSTINYFRVYWTVNDASDESKKGKAFILNCKDEAEAEKDPAGNVIYANTGNDIVNPVQYE